MNTSIRKRSSFIGRIASAGPLRRAVLAAANTLGVLALVLSFASPAQAQVIQRMEQNASWLEQVFSPAFDYDRDGCYATAAITPWGYVNPGLRLGGAVNGNCHDLAQLQQANTYSRSKCNNGWCAIMYASYFEKDQTVDGCSVVGAACGHTHDWEHVIAWVYNNKIIWLSVSKHAGWENTSYPYLRFDPSGSHPKVVYHKDGASTHFIRPANISDDAVENATGGWVYPALVGWNGYPSTAFRNQFIYHTSFGAASIKIGTESMKYALATALPPNVALDPWA